MDALTDQAIGVVGRDLEGDHLAVGGDTRHLGSGGDLHAHRRGRQVTGTDLHAHGALALRQLRLHALHGGILHQSHHKGGAEHLQPAGTDGLGGHIRGDGLFSGIGHTYFDHSNSSN